MRRRALLLAAVLLGLVVGCNKQSTSPTPSPSPTDTPAPTPTEAKTPTPVPTVSATLPGSASCVVEPFDFPVVSGIPPVTEADHARGPAGAPITFMEYADFQ